MIEEYVPVSQLISDLRSISQVEEICCAEPSGLFTDIANINDYSHTVRTIEAWSNYLSFFNIPHKKDGTATDANTIYLGQELFDLLVADGLDTDNVEIIISGAFTESGFTPEKRNTYTLNTFA